MQHGSLVSNTDGDNDDDGDDNDQDDADEDDDEDDNDDEGDDNDEDDDDEDLHATVVCHKALWYRTHPNTVDAKSSKHF